MLGWVWVWVSGINLTRGRGKVKGVSGRECIDEMQGGQRFGSALLRYELAWDGARGFGSALLRCELTRGRAKGFRIGNGCLGMVLMTWE